MRTRAVAALVVLSAALIAAGGTAGAVSRSYWHSCPQRYWSGSKVIYLQVHHATCRYGKRVAKHGFRPHTLRTRVGNFRCTKQRNAENVVWVYECYRHHQRQGVFFDRE
jgi:hypothetical protein